MSVETEVYAPGYTEHGLSNGYEYLIYTTQFCPCCYLILHEADPFYEAEEMDEVTLNVHGGCTFFSNATAPILRKRRVRGFEDDTNAKIIGWDYGQHTFLLRYPY